jgi:hypothetical protein
VSITISIGAIRFLRSASRNSATVFASTPALRAPRAAVREVVFAALRAFCWRARACPPFLAAALRLVAEPELDEARVRAELDADLLRDELDDDLLADERLEPDERLPLERLDPLDRFDPPRELPLLRRSAIWHPSWFPRTCDGTLPRNRDYLTS